MEKLLNFSCKHCVFSLVFSPPYFEEQSSPFFRHVQSEQSFLPAFFAFVIASGGKKKKKEGKAATLVKMQKRGKADGREVT